MTSLNWSAGLTGLAIYHYCRIFVFKQAAGKQYFCFKKNPEEEKNVVLLVFPSCADQV